MSEQPPLFPTGPEDPTNPGVDPGNPDTSGAPVQPPEFRDPYSSQERRREAIIEQRGDDLGAEQTGLKEGLLPSATDDSAPTEDTEHTGPIAPVTRIARRHPAAGNLTPKARPISGSRPVRGDSEADTGPVHYHQPAPPPLSREAKVIGLDQVRRTREELARKRRGDQTPPSA